MPRAALDPREVLGLDPDDGEAEIRRAFRRLAMRWHPDRNPDPTAHERFRLVRSAYESLMEVAEDEDDTVTTARPARSRGADKRGELWLRLEEAARGCEKSYRLVSATPCERCDGSGTITLSHTRMCGVCSGSGRVRHGRRLDPCAACEGRGFSARAECDVCAGSGETAAEQAVSVHVRAGLLDGEQLRLRGLGSAPEGEGDPGDLRLTVRFHPHPVFSLRGRDIHFELPVPALRLIAGGALRVPTLLGHEVITLPPGQASVHELRLAGCGFPGRAAEPAGDVVVSIRPVLPQELTPEQRRALGRLATQMEKDMATHYPEIAEWQAAIDSAAD